MLLISAKDCLADRLTDKHVSENEKQMSMQEIRRLSDELRGKNSYRSFNNDFFLPGDRIEVN